MRYEDTSGSLSNSAPEARDDADTLPNGSNGPASGNVITGAGTTTGKAGADVAASGHVIEVRGAGGTDAADGGQSMQVDGRYGALVMDDQGNYKYVADGRAPANFRDLFQYTLANSKGERSVADLVISRGGEYKVSENAQQIIPGPDGVVTLPPGVDLSDVHVVGRNLVIDMPDGTQIVIVDGAVFVPQLVIGGVEVPATNLAALLIDSEAIRTAAGPPQSSGGNFDVPVPPLDPGVPLGDLIPPTELVFTPPEFEEVGGIIDREPEAGAASAQLDDDAQQGGNPGGIGDVEPTLSSFSGSLPGSGGDGSLEWALQTNGTLPSGFSFAAQPNGDVWIMQGATHVLTVSVNEDTGAYTVTQVTAIDHPAGGDENDLSFIINYTVTDNDGDVAIGSLTINVDDDTPTVSVIAGSDSAVTLTTHDALTIGAGQESVSTTANFSNVFGATSFSPGADGAGPGTTDGYALSTTGGASGLTSHGVAINLYNVGGVIVGSTAASAAGITADNTIFTVSTTNTGIVTLTQFAQIDHTNTDPSPTGTPFEDHSISLADGAITLTRTLTVVDGDGDSVTGSASVQIGANLRFLDDGPTIGIADRGEPNLTVDESDLGTNASANFAANFGANFGADGPAASGSIAYALGINAGATGLIDVATGQPIVLVLNGGVVEGHVGDATGALAFTVSVDASGTVTLDQIRALQHPDGSNPDDSVTFANDNLVTLTATARDFDGDTANTTLNIGQNLNFKDDGPSISLSGSENSLTVDETNLAINATAAFAGAFTSAFGADGAGTVTYALSVLAPGANSGLVDVATGQPIVLVVNGGVVEGRVGDATGAVAFTVSVDASGNVTLDQIRAVVHPNPSNPDDSVTLAADNLVSLTATVTDKDGDSASATLNIGQNLNFEDDGPSISLSGSENSLTVDETNLAINAGPTNFATAFTPVFGADGAAAANSLTYVLGITGGNGTLSGLIDTATDEAVVLVNNGGVIEGRTQSSNLLVFTVTVNGSGQVTLDQLRAVVHPNTANPDDSVSLSADNLITLTATATDRDGDQASATLNIGQNLNFEDDGPSANNDTDTTDSATDQASGNVITGVGTNEGPANADAPGADGFGAITNLVGSTTSDNDPTGGFTAVGTHGTLQMDANGNYVYTRTGGPGGATDTFTYTYVDGDGDPATATLVITISDQTPVAGTVNILLDDDVIPGANGNPDGPGDNDPDTVGQNTTGGTLPGSGGDAPLTFGFGANVAPAGFTYDTSTPGTLLIKQGTTTVITITIDATTGAYTVTQNAPILHATGGDENNQIFTINYTVTDSDTDVANGTINIDVDDDSPLVTANGTQPNLTVDETNLAANATDSFAGVFAPLFGADGPAVSNSVTYALAITGGNGTNSGLIDVASGQSIVLVNNGGVIEGRTSGSNLLVFTVTVDGSGNVTLDQIRAIQHPNPANPDDSVTLAADNLITLTATVTDKDGDTASATANIGQNLNFEDDGPTAAITSAGFSISHDETAGNQGDANDVTGPLTVFDGVANKGDDPDVAGTGAIGFAVSAGAIASTGSSFGADGAGTTVFSLNISAPGVDSGINTTSGQDIFLFKEGDLIVGRVGNGSGPAAFALAIDPATGVVSMVQYLSIQQTNTGSNDESVSLTNTVVQATVTVTDKDGDVASQSTNIGSLISFQDDGPSAAVSTAGFSISHDETPGLQGDANDVAGPLTVFDTVANKGDDPHVAGSVIGFATSAGAISSTGTSFGADGGSAAFSLNVSAAGVDSGLNTTEGTDILLYKEGDLIVGRVGSQAGPAAFALSIDPTTGVVSMVQYLSIQHPNTGSADESVSIANGAVLAVVTATDGDGDTSTASTGIGSLISFQDDGPTLGVVQNQQTDNNPATAPAVGTLHFTPGADGAGSAMVITADVTGIKSGGFNLVTQQVGNVLTAYQDTDGDGIKDAGEATAVFTLTVNPSAGTSGQYVFDLITPLDPTVTDTPIGGSSSFGAGPTGFQVLEDVGGADLSVLTGYNTTGSFDEATWLATGNLTSAMITAAGINGSTAGWGVDNNIFSGTNEFMFFDFGAQPLSDPDGPGGNDPNSSGATLPNISTATFDFIQYTATDDIKYVVHYTDGTFDSGFIPAENLDPAGPNWVFTADAGKFIADIQLYTSGTAPGKVDLVSVGVQTSVLDKTIPFTVQLTDGDGDPTATANFSVHIATGLVPFAPAAPVVLDLNGDGVHFLGADAGVTYDYGHGAVATAWASPQDGILVNDANHDGNVSASEFVFGSDGVSDLQALAAKYGSSLDANDADFGNFAVWQDANSDGMVDGGELQSLGALGISSISLSSDGIRYSAADGDVTVVGTGSYTRTDGSTGSLADAEFLTGAARPASNSNAILMGALAAAGLAAESAAVASTHASLAATTALTSVVPMHSQTLAPVALDAVSGFHGADLIGASQGFGLGEAAAFHAPTEQIAARGLTGLAGEAHQQAESVVFAQGTQTPTHDGGGALASIMGAVVAMPSAHQLAGLASGGVAGAQHNQVVSQVLADALHGGNVGSIESMLSALPSQGGGHSVLEALASHGGAGVSNGDSSVLAGFAAAHAGLSIESMMVHFDAAPTHA
ncbi:MAG TPA: DUF5801 repeats-in-toxin domain-containing protein [Sphingomicrobium sp.]|nr:DUF5801 repeats-in-toxin domain-containing protein [Sphingomicrobium sp.]